LRFQPGERWGYSNVGYQVLALLVEKLSHQPFAEYMKQHVFIPAGMQDTYVQTSLAQTKDENRAISYKYNNHFEMKLEQVDTLPDWKEWTYNLTGLTGSSNVISNVNDLLNYDRALRAGILLQPATLAEAYTPTKLNSGENNAAIPDTSYGLGWFVSGDTSEGRIVHHSGTVAGASAMLLRNLDKKQVVILLNNVYATSDIGYAALAILNSKPVKYKKSLAFLYARDLYEKGSDYALSHFNELKDDSDEYSLKESEMDRVGLEFSRTSQYQHLSLETYKLNTLLFPGSWKTYDSYGSALLKNGKKEEARMAIGKSLRLNPDNEKGKRLLKALDEPMK